LINSNISILLLFLKAIKRGLAELRLLFTTSILLFVLCFFYACEKLDGEPPIVAILNLEENQTVYDIVTISIDASDNNAVEKVELWLDGEYSGISDTEDPFELEWNTISYENKTYSLFVRAHDVNSNSSETTPINIKVDNEGPMLTLLALQDNDIVFDSVVILVNATDNNAVEKVELWLDGKYSGISDTADPFELEWNTISYEDKIYSLTVRGYDINMNMSETTPINIKVENFETLTIPNTITATVHVNSEPEFRAAIQNDNTYVIIENDIILTNNENYKFGRGVIVNGNGSYYGDGGKILYANGTLSSGAFLEMGEESEIWGIKLIGNNSYDSKGIHANDKHNIKIKNCELTGFTNYAIAFGGNTSASYKVGYISSNYIHNNQQYPYGYGIVVNRNSEVYINKNKFKNNRHHVASRDHIDISGNDYLGVRYEASYNIVLENSEDEDAHFDVHGNESNGSCVGSGFLWDHGQAGNWIKIHHNIFLGNNETHILIRGVPTSTIAEGGGYQIYNNNFGPNMDIIATCADITSVYKTAAILFTDRNIVSGENFDKYVSIYENY